MTTSTEIENKLHDTRRRLAAVTAEIGDVMIGPGDGGKRLIALRKERDELRVNLEELEAAHAAAVRREADAEANRQAEDRERQFAEFKTVADQYTQTGVELAAALEHAAKLRVKLGKQIEQLEQKFPLGIVGQRVDFKSIDTMLNGAVLPVSIETLLAGEAYRNGANNAELPGAQAPVVSLQFNRSAIEPAAAAFKRAGAHFVRLLRDSINAIKTNSRKAA